MVLRAPEEGLDLQEILCGELLAQAVPDERYRIRGPEIRIGREAAAAIALTFHELTMNAISHGALGNALGTLEVSWHAGREDGSENLYLKWHESGVALADVAPRHKGFGTELLERMLPYELNASPNIEYSPDGMHIELHIPTGSQATIWRLPTQR